MAIVVFLVAMIRKVTLTTYSYTALLSPLQGKMWSDFMVSRPLLLPIIRKYTCETDKLFLQFLLDPSCLPLVISAAKSDPDILKHCMYLSRTWCYTVHIARMKLLKILNIL